MTSNSAITSWHQKEDLKTIRVAHLTSVHPPFDIRVFHKECVALSQAGYETVLIVPHGRNESVKGVRICAIPQPSNRRTRAFCTTWQVFISAVRERAAIYHFHDPELIPAGLLLKMLGKRVVYDAHENVSQDILTKDYIPPLFRKWLALGAGFLERFSSSFFDGIVAATPTIARRFSPSKTVTVQNFPVLDDVSTICRHPYSQRPFLAAYIGDTTLIRGIREMVCALELLPNNIDAKLALAAKFHPPELEEEVKQMPGWDRVDFVGWLPQSEVATLLAQARMGLVLFHPVPNYIDAQPHKLFDYMSAGLPIIASNFPLWREMIEGVGCGIVVDPLNPHEIADAMQWLWEHPIEAEEMGLRGQEAAISRFNWNNESVKLLDLYQGLLEPRKFRTGCERDQAPKSAL